MSHVYLSHVTDMHTYMCRVGAFNDKFSRHTLPHTLTHTHTHIHTYTQKYTHTLSCTHTHARTHACTHKHTQRTCVGLEPSTTILSFQGPVTCPTSARVCVYIHMSTINYTRKNTHTHRHTYVHSIPTSCHVPHFYGCVCVCGFTCVCV